MSALLSSRSTRRRATVFLVLLATTLGMMALSSNGLVLELQRGVGFAFRPVQAVVDAVAAEVASAVEAITEIDRLRQDNETLRAENDRLRSLNARLEATRRENDELTALLQLRSGLDHETVAARVVARESSEFRRVATLDRGTDDGLALGDVVIAAGGALAGRVVAIGPNFATVQLINDGGSTVVGELPSSGATGEVVGQLGGVLVMRNVDATVDVLVGEEVLTAGIELAGGVRSPYPRGLLLGQVVDVKQDANAVVQTVYLEPVIDPDRLVYVLVITDYDGTLPLPDELPGATPGPDASPTDGLEASPSPDPVAPVP
jgi:rod shape-determining protein MreC